MKAIIRKQTRILKDHFGERIRRERWYIFGILIKQTYTERRWYFSKEDDEPIAE